VRSYPVAALLLPFYLVATCLVGLGHSLPAVSPGRSRSAEGHHPEVCVPVAKPPRADRPGGSRGARLGLWGRCPRRCPGRVRGARFPAPGGRTPEVPGALNGRLPGVTGPPPAGSRRPEVSA
jgi:hypothetical protein